MMGTLDEVVEFIQELDSQLVVTFDKENDWALIKKQTTRSERQYAFIWDRPVTQKARGIKALNDPNITKWLNAHNIRVNPIIAIIGEETTFTKLDTAKWFYTTKVFGRPCPTVPTHGFVDSRPVSTFEEVTGLLEETLRHDKYGEIILQPAINASHNIIVANNQLIIGPGNDGATAGYNSLTVNMPSKMIDSLKEQLEKLDNKLVPNDEDFYFEFVGRKLNSYIVQARSGPRVQVTNSDFIPEDMIVKTVIKAKGDLIDWKTTCEYYKGVKGLVVDHNGGNTSSHYFIHCYTNSIPIVTTFTPKVGDTITATGENKLQFPEFFRGFALGLTKVLDTDWKNIIAESVHDYFANMLRASCVVFHSLAHQRDSFIVGSALGLFTRLGLMLCCGEARYCKTQTKAIPEFKGLDRKEVYSDSYDCGPQIVGFAQKAWWLFGHTNFPGECGGKAWEASTKIFLDILYAVFNGNMSEAVGMWNNAVNAAHNNGWLFNKLMSQKEFNQASDDPLAYLFQQRQVGNFYHIFSKLKSDPTTEFEFPELDFNMVIADNTSGVVPSLKSMKVARVQVRKIGDSRIRIQIRFKYDTPTSEYLFYEVERNVTLEQMAAIEKAEHKYKSMLKSSTAMYTRLTKSLKENAYILKDGTHIISIVDVMNAIDTGE